MGLCDLIWAMNFNLESAPMFPFPLNTTPRLSTSNELIAARPAGRLTRASLLGGTAIVLMLATSSGASATAFQAEIDRIDNNIDILGSLIDERALITDLDKLSSTVDANKTAIEATVAANKTSIDATVAANKTAVGLLARE